MRSLMAALLGALLMVLGCSPRPAVSPPTSTPSPASSTATTALDFGPQVEAAITDDASGRLDNIVSVLVNVSGKPTSEHYRHATTAATHTHVWSVTKSVVSTLVGIAIAEGKITSVDQTVADLLPERRRRMSVELSRTTLRELLTMSSGLTDQAYVEQTSGEDDTLTTILGVPLDADGTFSYSNVSSHLVAAIVAERVRMPLLSYARSRLFIPLGIDTASAYTGEETALQPSSAFLDAGFAWATTSDDFSHGCCMLKLTGRDMIAFGRLHLQDGRWGDRRILPTGWIREATAPSAANPDYGLMWWRQSVDGREAYAAIGAFGQLILVVPELSAVITVSSRQAGNSSPDSGDLLTMIEKVIIPEIE